MTDEIPDIPEDEPLDEELAAEAAEATTNDEAVPAARKLTTFESGGVGDADEALEEGANLSVSAKEAERRALEEAMRRFLDGGGRIQQIPSEVSGRKPKKPEEAGEEEV